MDLEVFGSFWQLNFERFSSVDFFKKVCFKEGTGGRGPGKQVWMRSQGIRAQRETVPVTGEEGHERQLAMQLGQKTK